MPLFQVSSRSVESEQLATPPKRPRRLRREWSAFIRFVVAVSAAGGLFTIVTIFKGSNDTVFILLPVFVYFAATQFQRYNLKLPAFALKLLLTATPVYLLLTICLAFIYYGAIIEVELLLSRSKKWAVEIR